MRDIKMINFEGNYRTLEKGVLKKYNDAMG